MFRDAATQDNTIGLEEYTSSVISNVSTYDRNTVIFKAERSFLIHKDWVNKEVKATSKPKMLRFSQVTRKQTTTRARLKAGIKEAKRRPQ